MKNSILILAIFSLTFISCGSKKTYKYEDAITSEVKEMKEKLKVLEGLPGQEDEKKAMRTNIAVAELGNLTSYEIKVKMEYLDKNGKKMTEEDEKDFKTQIEYDKHVKELEDIIEKNKLE